MEPCLRIRTKPKAGCCDGGTESWLKQLTVNPEAVLFGLNDLHGLLANTQIIVGPKNFMTVCAKGTSHEVYLEPMAHILINSDLYGTKEADGIIPHVMDYVRLEQISPRLTLGQNNFKLAGVVAYTPGHFIAYLHTRSGWWMHDGLRKKVCHAMSP